MKVMHTAGRRLGNFRDGFQLRYVHGIAVFFSGCDADDLTIELLGPGAAAACRPPDSDGASRVCSGVLHCCIAAHIDRGFISHRLAVGNAVAAKSHSIRLVTHDPYAQRHRSAHLGMILDSSNGICANSDGIVSQSALIAVIQVRTADRNAARSGSMRTWPQSDGRNTVRFRFGADRHSVRSGSAVILIVAACVLERRMYAEIMNSSCTVFILWRLCRRFAPDRDAGSGPRTVIRRSSR